MMIYASHWDLKVHLPVASEVAIEALQRLPRGQSREDWLWPLPPPSLLSLAILEPPQWRLEIE
jgi:hypothetical protein